MKLYRPKELSEIVSISVWTLRDWAKRGYISKLQTPGGDYRYSLEEVLEVLRKGKRNGKKKGFTK